MAATLHNVGTLTGIQWLSENDTGGMQEIAKPTQQTRAWFAEISGRGVFVKWYPNDLTGSWARAETTIAGSNLHPAIIPLWQRIDCCDGVLLIYERVAGKNLGPQEVRGQFQSLPLAERSTAVISVSEALAAVCEAGFMIVDWHEGNMIYDFDSRRIWLFDWELCQEGGFLILSMDSNYGSSRLMAPEEFVRGSRLDQSTLVFNLARYALLVLPELAERLAPILARASYPAKSGRYSTVREFLIPFSVSLKS